jgi:hypothetical protein
MTKASKNANNTIDKVSTIKKPKTRTQQALWYLISLKEFSLYDVVKLSGFIKFQTRLSDLEKVHGRLAKRTTVKFVNIFGRADEYYLYSALDIEKCKSIYNKITRIEVKKN